MTVPANRGTPSPGCLPAEQRLRGFGDQPVETVADLKTAPRQPDGGFEQFGPGQAAMSAMGFGQQRDSAWRADRPAADHRLEEVERLAGRIEKQFGRRLRRRCLAAVKRDEPSGVRIEMDKEGAAAEAGRLRLAQSQDELYRDHGVDR